MVKKMDQFREGSLGFQRRREGGRPVCSRALRAAGVGPGGGLVLGFVGMGGAGAGGASTGGSGAAGLPTSDMMVSVCVQCTESVVDVEDRSIGSFKLL